MSESSHGLDDLRYVYFTGDSVQNGPMCHSCMNDAFCSTKLAEIEHVFAITEAGLVPFLIRSLVFLYGMATPFSLRNISERLLVTECVQCAMTIDLPVAGDAEFCGSTQETPQEICKTERERHQDVVYQVIESMRPALSNWHCERENQFIESRSEVSRRTEFSGECFSNTELIQTEHEGSSTGNTGVTHSAARDNSSQAAVPFPNENKKRIRSEDAVSDAKRVKTDIEENFNSGMIITWGNLEVEQVQMDAIHNEDGEETRNSASTSSAITVLEHHSTQPLSTTCSAFPSAKDHCRPEEPWDHPEEWFPFIRGRSRSAVADPISLDAIKCLREWVKGDRKGNPLNFMLAEKFNHKEKITCLACNLTVPLHRSGYVHFLGKCHFKSISNQRRVFSKSQDMLRLEELLNDAIERKKRLLAEAIERRHKWQKDAKKREDSNRAVCDSKINGINFPFLRGRIQHYVQSPIGFGYPMQKPLDAISSEVESNPKLRSLARQTYFRDQPFHFCDYCKEDVNMHDLFMHSISALHIQKVLCTGEVFCKIRDYDEMHSILEKLKRKVNGWRLPLDSRLPFGYGKTREDNLLFVPFEDIFNFITALKRTGKLDNGFCHFLIERYRDAAEVDLCSHCGPLATENSTAIPHFLSINHIAKAMEIGKVFVRDLTVLKNLLHSYLHNSNCRDTDVILQRVESAIQNKMYSMGSMEFAQLSSQILKASYERLLNNNYLHS